MIRDLNTKKVMKNAFRITKTKYKVTELSMKKNKAYILSIIYRGKGYYLDVYL